MNFASRLPGQGLCHLHHLHRHLCQLLQPACSGPLLRASWRREVRLSALRSLPRQSRAELRAPRLQCQSLVRAGLRAPRLAKLSRAKLRASRLHRTPQRTRTASTTRGQLGNSNHHNNLQQLRAGPRRGTHGQRRHSRPHHNRQQSQRLAIAVHRHRLRRPVPLRQTLSCRHRSRLLARRLLQLRPHHRRGRRSNPLRFSSSSIRLSGNNRRSRPGPKRSTTGRNKRSRRGAR